LEDVEEEPKEQRGKAVNRPYELFDSMANMRERVSILRVKQRGGGKREERET
jgi:hypothetical protein